MRLYMHHYKSILQCKKGMEIHATVYSMYAVIEVQTLFD